MASELSALFETSAAPKSYTLCAADKTTRTCKGERGPTAKGLGGLFIPLRLNVREMTILSQIERSSEEDGEPEKIDILASFDTRVNGIAPKCKEARGWIEPDTGVLEFQRFYCRWLAIGNVAARVKLTIDRVNQEDGTFSGQYRLRLNGTGNLFGRGYFLATLR